MNWPNIIWDDLLDGNVEHIEEHGLSIDDVELVLQHANTIDTSDSSGNPCVFGYTSDGRYIIVVFEQIDEDTIIPVTAYEAPEPGGRYR